MAAPFTFILPDELSAKEPPERRGVSRDRVRLLVLDRATGAIEHSRFDRLSEYLRSGDLLVFNSSRTLPASLSACTSRGPCLEVRLAQHLPDDSWLALLVCKGGDPFECGLRSGMDLEFGEDCAVKSPIAMRAFPGCGKFASPNPAPSWLIYFTVSANRFVTNTSPHHGISTITRRFTRRNQARRKCRRPAELLPGACFFNCDVTELISPISSCIPVSLPISMMSSIARIQHRRRNIS